MKIINKISIIKGRLRQVGFTLVELALVVAALAIISVSAIVVSDSVLSNARSSSMISQINTVQTSAELARVHTSCRALKLNFLVTDANAADNSCGKANLAGWEGPYIRNAIILTTGIMSLETVAAGAEMEMKVVGGIAILEVEAGSNDVLDGIVASVCPDNLAASSLANISATKTCFSTGSVVNLYMSQ